MPNPPNTRGQAPTEEDAHRAARDAARPNRAETDPGAAQPGARAYEDRPVEGMSQGPMSPGASEPGGMGRAGGAPESRPEGQVRAEDDQHG